MLERGHVRAILSAIDIIARLMHLVHRDGDDRGEVEEEPADIVIAIGDETLLRRDEIVILEIVDGHLVIEGLRVLGRHRSKHPILHHDPIVAIRLRLLDEVEDVALGKGGEEEAVLDFVIAVIRAEEGFEFIVAEFGEGASSLDRFLLELIEFLDAVADEFLVVLVAFAGHPARLAGEMEVRRGLAAEDEPRLVPIEGRGMGGLGVEGLGMGLGIGIAFGVAVGGRPGDGEGAFVDFVLHFVAEHFLQDEGIALDVAGDNAKDRGVRIGLLVHAKPLHQIAKALRREGTVEVDDGRGLLHDFGGHVVVEHGIEGRHIGVAIAEDLLSFRFFLREFLLGDGHRFLDACGEEENEESA